MAITEAMSRKARVNMFVDVLLARRTANTRRAEYTYLLLILLWHLVVFTTTIVLVDWWLGFGAIPPIPQPFEWNRVREQWLHPFFGAFLLVLVLVEGLVGWLFFRVVNRRHRPNSRLFIRSWWRACGWGTITVPVLSFMIANASMQYDIGMNGILLGPIFLMLGPAWLVQDELKPHRRSRWRPECPECGYSLRGLPEPRCPECGMGFPTKSSTFRHWAVRRLAWDRSPRGSPLAAYLKSLASVVFLPGRAARGVAVPDRWKRCGRWAAVHFLLAALAGMLLGSGRQYVRWLDHRIWPPTFQPPHLFGLTEPPFDRVTLWAALSFLAWLLPLLLAVLIACLTSFCAPGRHRAAKLGGVKWSLYLTPLFLLVLTAWHGFFFVFPPHAQGTMPRVLAYKLPAPEIPLWVLIVPYGVWWAIGMAANQYNRARNWTATAGYASAFFAVWLLTTRVLFAPGPLEALR
jgi:hypothetical protein